MAHSNFTLNLVKDSLVYGLTRYVSVIAAIFLTPVYTRIIPRYDYGIMDILNVWITFSMLLIPFGLIQALPKIWSEHQNDPIKLKRAIGNLNFLFVTQAVLFLIAANLFEAQFQTFILEDESFTTALHTCLGVVVLQVFYTLHISIVKQQFKRRLYTAISLLNLSILTTMGFTLVYFFDQGIVGFFRASFLALAVSTTVLLIVNRSFLNFNIDASAIKDMVRYSAPLMLVALFFSLSEIIDRYLINTLISTEEVGLYSVGSRIASIPLFFTQAFATAWFPRIFSVDNEKERGKLLLSTNQLALLFFGLVFLGVVLFRNELIWFFAPDYVDASLLIVLISLVHVIIGLGPIYAIGIHLHKKSMLLFRSAVISIILNIAVSIALIGSLGVEGVAIGTLVGALSWTYLRYHYGNGFLHLPFDFKSALPLILLAMLFTAGIFYLPAYDIFLFIMKLAVAILLSLWVFRKIKPLLK